MQASVVALRDPEPERVVELSRRPHPPVHYEVEINPVLELLKFKTYESGVFEAGGYKWSLCLHPQADPDRRGKPEYISLYLSMEKPNKLRDGERIVVDYKFFAYDYNSSTYVIFKEKGKELRAFTKTKTQWGFSKFLSLKAFNNPNNGYCKDKKCKFGAEVMVSNITRTTETVTIVKDPRRIITTCKIGQFSPSSKEIQSSNSFDLGKKNGERFWRWKLKVKQKDEYLSVYLQSQDHLHRIKMYVEAKLRVVNKKDRKNDKEKTVCLIQNKRADAYICKY
ncbi:ubiquitin carboxyl-terminal hydrolase 13-like isoform X2 [Eucalyptus grandis]|uniref:ubiquitin carboxyl-terminal hydrolase 13-like isoform X2 n=1 Tax=Eucalyptus grandis TaxID=71139 RepID=UPI00192E791F|nr:ubiquitin carboxyl-terminal hydrolase 13-like isoform X2 [Eucalyptus grandis]